jgi:hypothetical protein
LPAGVQGEPVLTGQLGGGTAGPGRQVLPSGPDGASPLRSMQSGSQPATTQPQALLAAAARELEARDSVSAEIRHEVDLFGKHLVGSGHYWEQRQDGVNLMRLELKIQLGDQTSSLLEVLTPPGPNGQFLWTSRKLSGKVELSRIDVSRARKALSKAAGSAGPGDTSIMPGLGGLSKVLRGLYRFFDFPVAQRGQWGRENRPVWRLEGRWKTEQLLRLLPEQKEAIEAGQAPDLSRLPEHLPDHVILLLGEEDLFPYRIEYRRAVAPGVLESSKADSRALVTMQLFDVVLNVPIDPRLFQYTGDTKFVDRTGSFLESLGGK